MSDAPLSAPEAIVRRRSARRFDPNRPIPDDLLVRILGLSAQAPSGYNLQPWRFLVVRSERNRHRLRACAFNQPKVSEAPVTVIVLGYKRAYEADLAPMLDHRVSIGGMRAEAAAEVRGRVASAFARHTDAELAVWALRSGMLAVGTMMIAAKSLGVDSSPLEGFDPAKVHAEFGIPDDHIVCCLVCLGYSAQPDAFPGRFALERLCFEEHFGQPWTLGEPPDEG
jgi:nitroreductase